MLRKRPVCASLAWRALSVFVWDLSLTMLSFFRAATKSLKSAEAAHKHTTAELQRTRSSFQTFRQTQAAENKRREKESERMIERWSKLSDAQSKIGSSGSGIRFKSTHANAAVASAGTESILGKGKNMLEAALDDAEQARKELLAALAVLDGR